MPPHKGVAPDSIRQSDPDTLTLTQGALWPDTDGNHINAHGGCVLLHEGTYYWFGEHKAERTSSALVGITCYSSADLIHWQRRGVALSVSNERGADLDTASQPLRRP